MTYSINLEALKNRELQFCFNQDIIYSLYTGMTYYCLENYVNSKVKNRVPLLKQMNDISIKSCQEPPKPTQMVKMLWLLAEYLNYILNNHWVSLLFQTTKLVITI